MFGIVRGGYSLIKHNTRALVFDSFLIHGNDVEISVSKIEYGSVR